METRLEKVEKNIAEFEVEIPALDFEQAVGQAYKKNISKFNLPGFRKGKAPRKMIEQFYGEGVFYEDAINIILPDAYDKAVEELKLEPVGRPDVDVTQVGNGENLIVKFNVDVKPEVTVENYKGIEIEQIEYNVSDDDVNAELSKLQDRNARMITVEDRAVEEGDTANIDYEGFVDGVAFEGGKGEGHPLVIGAGQFIPGFEPQIVGMKIGEEKTIDVSFPEEYHSEDLKGKAAQFKVKVNSISKKELPELDDELAKDVSEFETLAELKEDIKTNLTTQAENRQKADIENSIIQKLIDTHEFDIPESMIDTQIENLAKDFDMRLGQQGLNLEKYFEITGMTIDAFKEQNYDQAKNQVKANLLVEAVAKAEKIDITQEELDAEYVKMAENYKVEVDSIKSFFAPENLKKDLTIQKAVVFLVENAKIGAAKKKSEKATKASAKAAEESSEGDKKPEKTTKPKATKKTTKEE